MKLDKETAAFSRRIGLVALVSCPARTVLEATP